MCYFPKVLVRDITLMKDSMSSLTSHFRQSFDFSEAPLFLKTARLPVAFVTVARGGEHIENLHTDKDGSVFKQNDIIANNGDHIIARAGQDIYTVPAEKFNAIYVIDPKDPAQYMSRNAGRAIFLEQDTTIISTRGHEQYIKAGGVVFEGYCGEIYGNQDYSFEEDFARQASDGSLMPLTKPLGEQLKWALEKGENLHVTDIQNRMRFQQNRVLIAAPTLIKPALG
jgi:hypothetical protein